MLKSAEIRHMQSKYLTKEQLKCKNYLGRGLQITKPILEAMHICPLLNLNNKK